MRLQPINELSECFHAPIMPSQLKASSGIALFSGAPLRTMRQKSVKGPHYDTALARSLRLLIEREAENRVNRWALARKLNQTTVNSIANGSMDTKISTADKIAEASGYSLSQLLRDDFDPRTMAPAKDERAAYVASLFASIRDPKDRQRAEAIIEQFAPSAHQATEQADLEPTLPRQRAR